MTQPLEGSPAFATENSCVEADLVDISTQIAGRIAVIEVDEGDLVATGATLDRIDTRTLEAQLAFGAEARIKLDGFGHSGTG